MNLDNRVKRLEGVSKEPDPLMSTDEAILKLGLDSDAIQWAKAERALTGVEIMAEMLGLEYQEFARLLKDTCQGRVYKPCNRNLRL